MAIFQSFDRTITIAPGSADNEFIEQQIAALARSSLLEARQSGEASSSFIRAVNGRIGAAEESVVAPGDIVYTFSWLREASLRARELFLIHSPVRTGRYRSSFIMVADGQQVIPKAISNQRVVQVVNTQPYSRKIQVGARGYTEHRGLFDLVARRLRSEFPSVVQVRVKFIRLVGGAVLRRTTGRRRDRRAGADINYPAIEIFNQQTLGFNA
jgi:hypothetical protein